MNPSIAYIRSSDGSGDASLMTITQVRTAPATTIMVNTVAGVPTNFFATMGTPHTFTDPVTGETITVISEATAVNFAGRIDSGKVEIVAIAPGETDLGSKVGDIIIIRPTTQWADNLHDVLAESHNDDGSLKNGIVTADKIDFATFGVKIGTIPGATFGTTGYKAITGLGFKPRMVRFFLMHAAASSTARTLQGVATGPASQRATYTLVDTTTSGNFTTNSAEDLCIAWRENKTTDGMKASFVSMDNDGFTINVLVANGNIPIGYEAVQ